MSRRKRSPSPEPVVRGRGRPRLDAGPGEELVKVTILLDPKRLSIVDDIVREKGLDGRGAGIRAAIDACGFGS